MRCFTTALITVIICCACSSKKEPAVTWPKGEWKRHTIDDSSRGADGTRFADINGDGLLDITTAWETEELSVASGLGRWMYGIAMHHTVTDLDRDGDLDVVTVEEKGPNISKGEKLKELGIIWYGNPAQT
jgi:hypothetical protein